MASKWLPSQFSLVFVGCPNGKLPAVSLSGSQENGNVSHEDDPMFILISSMQQLILSNV